MKMNSTAISHTRARTFAATGLLALAIFAAAAVPARASTRRQQGTTAPDTIRGIVFDSLLHQPIPEATVQANAGTY
jgi:hypothetical protein